MAYLLLHKYLIALQNIKIDIIFYVKLKTSVYLLIWNSFYL